MHKGRGTSDESEDCSMRSVHVPTDAALMALTTGLGIPASSSMVIGPPSTRPIRAVAVAAASVVDFPDSPPPRA